MTPTRTQRTRELAHRSSAGIDVTLVWDEASGEITVSVFDLRSGELLELPARPGQALDVFNHPFAYLAAAPVHKPALAA